MWSELRAEPVPPKPEAVVRVQGVGKRYQLFARPADRLYQELFRTRPRHLSEVTVLQDVTFSVARGETIGIIGRNGAGKSTLLQIIAGILRPSEGEVETRGRIAPLIELGTGFNLELTGRENVIFNGLLLGMSRDEVDDKYAKIVAFADIGEYIDRPVKTYSSGMYARLAFSVAVHLDPEILIVDEILSVGDLAFQRKCMERFYEIRSRGCTILLVAHDEYMIRSVCQKALYLRAGRMVAFGNPADVVGQYVEDTMPTADCKPVGTSPARLEAPAASGPTAAAHDSHSLASGAADARADTVVETPAPSAGTEGSSPDRIYRITHVALLDEAGRPTDVVRHGDTMHLEFTFEALTSDLPDKISFVFNLYSVDGEYVCGSTTLMEGFEAHPGAHAGRVRVTFPDVKLLAGQYHWRVAINDLGGLYVLQYANHVCPFRVAIDDEVSVGIVHLERHWEVELHAPHPHAGDLRPVA